MREWEEARARSVGGEGQRREEEGLPLAELLESLRAGEVEAEVEADALGAAAVAG